MPRMQKAQSIENKKGEVDFRRKLALQFEGKGIYFEGEPSKKENLQLIKERAQRAEEIFNTLKQKGVELGPFLEIGSGIGQCSMVLVNKFNQQGFCSDLSLETLTLAKKFNKDLKSKKLPILITADAYNLPFRSKSLSFVFCFQTLHHLPDPKPVLEEIKRVLAPGGYFYFNEEPVAQTINLNLWRRDHHLRWFEKILKYLIVLHFISRIGKSETENNILEETFTLSVWEKALNVFNKVEAKLIVFPFGFKLNRSKSQKKGWLNPSFLQKFILGLLGGGIEALCQTSEEKKLNNQINNVFEMLACPNCKDKPNLAKKAQDLVCPKCKTLFNKKRGVFMLLSEKLKENLKLRKD